MNHKNHQLPTNPNMPILHIINGPNLNLVGKREPTIYGNQSFEEFIIFLEKKYPTISIYYFQSNHEGEIIDKIHEIGYDETTKILLNAGAYSHTSIAIADAVRAITAPVVEIHISNTAAREAYRHHSYISEVSIGTITGLGLKGYELGIQYFSE